MQRNTFLFWCAVSVPLLGCAATPAAAYESGADAGPLRQPQRFFAIIAKGDEVLDWREMTARYPGARIKLLSGGDHALSDFDDHLDELFAFLGLR